MKELGRNLLTRNWMNLFLTGSTKDVVKVFGCQENSFRHFSHVFKSHIFKNLNLRKEADRNFRGTFLKNHFRHLKLYSNPPSWLARSHCHMSKHLLKDKRFKFNFWQSQPFRFRYVKVHCQRRLKSTKKGISS